MTLERQPTRSNRVREDRRFDKTQLRIGGHGRTVHRDYLAHALRWGFVAEEIERAGKVVDYVEGIALRYGWVQRNIPQGQKVLDIGCGQDQPLLYVLGARNYPKTYVGVDLNRISKKSNVKWATIYDQFDFVNRSAELFEKHGKFNVATCFEVAEHMEPPDFKQLLLNVLNLLEDDGTFYLSTPVFNGMAAANHIHEYRIDELTEVLESAGFKIKAKYGTFASKTDLYHVLKPEERELFDKLWGWFGNEVMATILAPLYPDHSRNICWVLQKA
jgi:SAM-dependent methyltransferase